jgi:hypothetical protein
MPRPARHLAALIAGAAALAAPGGVLGSRSERPRHPLSAAPVRCTETIGSRRKPGAGERVVLGAVAAPPARIQRPVAVHGSRWPRWMKVGLGVRAGRGPVTVAVPRGWRDRAAITWGNGRPAVSSLTIARCPPLPHAWNYYAGGFFVRTATACVPLVIWVGPRARTIRVGLGRRC